MAKKRAPLYSPPLGGPVLQFAFWSGFVGTWVYLAQNGSPLFSTVVGAFIGGLVVHRIADTVLADL
jgi:hypothetical protein